MEYYLWLGFVAILSFVTGFVSGKPHRPKSEIDLLLEQIKWLPIISVRNERVGRHSKPVIRLEGGIELIASAVGGAYISYNDIGIGVKVPEDNWITLPLNKKMRNKIASIFHNRLSEHLLDSSTKKMLCENTEGR